MLASGEQEEGVVRVDGVRKKDYHDYQYMKIEALQKGPGGCLGTELEISLVLDFEVRWLLVFWAN